MSREDVFETVLDTIDRCCIDAKYIEQDVLREDVSIKLDNLIDTIDFEKLQKDIGDEDLNEIDHNEFCHTHNIDIYKATDDILSMLNVDEHLRCSDFWTCDMYGDLSFSIWLYIINIECD